MEWTHEQKSAVWNKADTVANNDPKVYRKDQCGAWIRWADYGDRKSEYGWEVDHITPQSQGGSDAPSNLRALQWQNNVATSDGRLTCAVTANGNHNGPAQ